MKAVAGAFNQEKALIVQLHRLIVYSTSLVAVMAVISVTAARVPVSSTDGL